jgi:glycosyltransferase involved in cell wall biosynthesis
VITAYFMALAALLVCIAVVFFIRLHGAFKHYRIKHMSEKSAELPSVTVCIPARNEMHAMTQCLEHVLASNYEKLEIIVYDDSSADDTSILIRSFAHEGVRFVPGTTLPEGWLGRNYALETLAKEASGAYLLFLDVDTLVQPTTVSQLVNYTLANNATMVSVLPQRSDLWRPSVLFSTLRYFWQLILARKMSPTVSSSAWLIERESFLAKGSFASHKAEVQPETHIAASLGAAYLPIVSNLAFGISFEKRWGSQIETSRRLLFPMVGGSWWQGVLGVLALVLLNVPFFTILTSLTIGWMPEHSIMAAIQVLFMAVYGYYAYFMWRTGWWFGALLFPVIIFQELVVFIQSIIGYSRHSITWKGRPVAVGSQRTDSITLND